MMHNHNNILSLFCLSSEVFVDDCVLQFQKAERFYICATAKDL